MDDEPNYDSYNLRQIRDVYAHIDRDAYPERFARILERKQLLESNPRQIVASSAGGRSVLEPSLSKDVDDETKRKALFKSSYRQKSIAFFVVFLACFGFYLTPKEYPSDDLNGYAFKKVTVDSMRVYEQTGRYGYFELEIYDIEPARYFLRNRDLSKFTELQAKLNKGTIIDLHYVKKGFHKGRIANLRLEGSNMVSLSSLIADEASGRWVALLFSFIAAILSVYFYRQRSKDENDEEIHYL